jgi:hypothetical protein
MPFCRLSGQDYLSIAMFCRQRHSPKPLKNKEKQPQKEKSPLMLTQPPLVPLSWPSQFQTERDKYLCEQKIRRLSEDKDLETDGGIGLLSSGRSV